MLLCNRGPLSEAEPWGGGCNWTVPDRPRPRRRAAARPGCTHKGMMMRLQRATVLVPASLCPAPPPLSKQTKHAWLLWWTAVLQLLCNWLKPSCLGQDATGMTHRYLKLSCGFRSASNFVPIIGRPSHLRTSAQSGCAECPDHVLDPWLQHRCQPLGCHITHQVWVLVRGVEVVGGGLRYGASGPAQCGMNRAVPAPGG